MCILQDLCSPSVIPNARGRGKKETPMDTHDQQNFPTSSDTSALPAVVDRATWQTELDKLRVREKAHTREGDAIAAARRRLPMVEVDPTIQLLGPHGPVTLLEVFEGRRLLIVYFHMWHTGQPASAQCEGCTFSNGQIRELSYLHSRDVTYATFCQGPYEESVRYRDFMDWDMPWYSAQDSAEALLAGRALAKGRVATINALAADPDPAPRLTAAGEIGYRADEPAAAALSRIARDAIELLAGSAAARVRECAAPDCA